MSALAFGGPAYAVRRPFRLPHRGRPSRRVRLLRTALLAAVLLAAAAGLLIAVLVPSAAAGDERPATATTSVVVGEDENLWSIVETGGYDRDPRIVISEIRSMNGLATSVVHPGQELTVPAR
ncbi:MULTISPECIES: LysM peptidoglycan-binding domain-containing protein [Brevibacterium]|nr:LysM peptidoglycan-binding domain-containing protein [Brevibacterium sp.]